MIPIANPLTPDRKLFQLYLNTIFATGQMSNNGPFVKELESSLKNRLGVQNLLIFNNGTIALMLALKALNLSDGDILTTPFTFPATVNVLPWLNLNPVFCDVDYETMNITPEAVEDHITSRSVGIVPVHVFGYPCDVYGFQRLSESYNLKIVYDAAHAFNVKVNGTGIGNFGDITMFSFHPTKLFHSGEGGGLSFSDPELAQPLQQLRNFGIQDEETGSVLPGINGKLSEIQAALGICILEQLPDELLARRDIFEYYKLKLSNTKIIKLPENIFNSLQYFPIRTEKRDKIFEALKKNNIQSRKYFYPLCSQFPHFKSLAKLPVAEQVVNEVLCLPFHGRLTYDDIDKISEIIGEIE